MQSPNLKDPFDDNSGLLKIDSHSTAATSIVSFVQELVTASTPREQVEVARRYVSTSGPFNEAFISTLQTVWFEDGEWENDDKIPANRFLRLNEAWQCGSIVRFLDTISNLLTDDIAHDKQLLAEAALVTLPEIPEEKIEAQPQARDGLTPRNG